MARIPVILFSDTKPALFYKAWGEQIKHLANYTETDIFLCVIVSYRFSRKLIFIMKVAKVWENLHLIHFLIFIFKNQMLLWGACEGGMGMQDQDIT